MGKKYNVDTDYFKKWSKDMAYVLGFFFADGSMEYSPLIRGTYIRFSSTDKEMLVAIRQALRSEHTLVKRFSTFPSKDSYLLRIGNRTLYNTLETYGLHPNKSKTVHFPNVPARYHADFVRGYFDGDGCVHLERTKRKKDQKIVIRRLHTSFTSGSKVFLEALNISLSELSQVSSKVYQNTRSYQLRFSTKSSVRLFKYLYGGHSKLRLSRKFELFRAFFVEKEDWLDSEIQNILNHH
jgi:intein/homing endonuclease